jgi:hypothetical protein
MESKEGWIPIELKVRKLIPEKLRKPGEPVFVWEEQGFNMSNFNNWRQYMDDDETGSPNFFTIVYMIGNPKGVILPMKGADFLKACKEAVKKHKEESN